MIVSKYSKSYDTADGSEQQFEDAPGPAVYGGSTGRQRWEDDGGGPLSELPDVPPVELTQQPAWSVLSLRDLNEAIRREASPAARLKQASDLVQRRRARAIQCANDKAAAAVRAERDKDRNAWEHT
jgi:hypothetical protein